MDSKLIADRVAASTSVATVEKTHGPALCTALARTLNAPEAEAAAAVLLHHGTRQLKQVTDALVAADRAHLDELGDDAGPRLQRDAQQESLRALLVDTRALLLPVFGVAFTQKLGFDGPTPKRPDRLLAAARRVASNLRQAEAPAGKRLVTVDLSGMADALDARITPLAKALQQVQEEEREAEVTLVRKHEAIEKFDEVFTATAGLISALLQAAGEEELADRVRPSTARPGRTADQTLSTTTPEDTSTDAATPTTDPIP